MKKDNNLYTLKEWYDDKETSAIDLTEKQFYELLDLLDFELKSQELENGIIIYFLKDLQGGNLGNIEQDIFYCEYDRKSKYGVYQGGNLGNIEQDIFYCEYDRKSKYGVYEQLENKENWLKIKDSIIDRLEIYLYDYFVRDKLYE
jgi:hypothetical protein